MRLCPRAGAQRYRSLTGSAIYSFAMPYTLRVRYVCCANEGSISYRIRRKANISQQAVRRYIAFSCIRKYIALILQNNKKAATWRPCPSGQGRSDIDPLRDLRYIASLYDIRFACDMFAAQTRDLYHIAFAARRIYRNEATRRYIAFSRMRKYIA